MIGLCENIVKLVPYLVTAHACARSDSSNYILFIASRICHHFYGDGGYLPCRSPPAGMNGAANIFFNIVKKNRNAICASYGKYGFAAISNQPVHVKIIRRLYCASASVFLGGENHGGAVSLICAANVIFV